MTAVEPAVAPRRRLRRQARVDPARTSRGWVLVLVGLHVLLAGVLVRAVYQSRFELSNIDGISYINIARQYLEGHTDAAVNAYWSPLVSWLMVPLMALGVGDSAALVAVSAAGGLVATALACRLVLRATGGHGPAALVVVVSTAVFALGNLRVLTPDLLVVAAATALAGAIARCDDALRSGDRGAQVRASVVLGVVCAVCYVTKLYLVPVAVVAAAGWLVVRALLERVHGARLRPLVMVATAAGVAAVLAAPWVVVLSTSYGHVTAGSSLSVNLESKFVPDAGSGGTTAAPLWAPPNEHAVSFGEDRTAQTGTVSSGSAASTSERLEYYVSQRFAAFQPYLDRIASVAPFAVAIMVTATLLLVLGRVPARPRPVVLAAALVWVPYFLGYAAITTAATLGGNARYYWPLLTLSLIVACALVPDVLRAVRPPTSRWRRAVVVALVLVLPASVVWQHGMGRAAPFSDAPASTGLRYLVAPAQRPEIQRVAEDELAPVIPAGSRLVGSNYRMTLRLAYYLRGQVYGRAEQGYDISQQAFRDEMRAAGIDFYIAFTPASEPAPDLGDLGVQVAEVESRTTCSDIKGAVVEDCVLRVVRLED